MQSCIHSLSRTSRKLSTLQCFQHQWEKTSKSFVALLRAWLSICSCLSSTLCTRKVLWWLFFSFCREEHGSISLLYRRSSHPSCNLSSLGRRSSGMSTQLLSPPLPILLLLLFSFLLFSNFTNSFSPPLFSQSFHPPPPSSILVDPLTPPTLLPFSDHSTFLVHSYAQTSLLSLLEHSDV